MNFRKLKHLVYHTTDYEHHTANVYLPMDGVDHPFVICVHGGAFQAGAKEMYDAWGPFLARHGIASMSVNYTLSSLNRASYPTLLDDMNAAINFVVKHAADWGINPMKLGFMGDSAGGYLGSMAAFSHARSSAKVKFVVSAYGVMDIVDWAHYTNATRDDFVVNKLFGTDVFVARRLYEEASPINLIDEAVRTPTFDTSFFMIWGGRDEIVKPQKQTLAFIEKLKQYNIPYETHCEPELGHFWFTKNEDKGQDELLLVLKEVIGPKVVAFIKEKTGG